MDIKANFFDMMISKSQPVVHDDKMGNIWATATKKSHSFSE